MKAFLTYAALYGTFAIDHAVDVYAFDHYATTQGPGGTYRMLLIAGLPISMGSALFFLFGGLLLRLPRIAPRVT